MEIELLQRNDAKYSKVEIPFSTVFTPNDTA